MARTSRKRDKIFFSYRQAGMGTPHTTCFHEGRGTMTFPEPEYQFESDKNKLGSGEHGRKTELQATWAPWTYTCQRMSEIAYFLSYFQGRQYAVTTSGSLEQHELFHLGVDDRVMPLFTFQYGTGTANAVFSDNVVNEFSITVAAGGNGIIEATFSGWGNKHRIVGQAFALNATGSMSSGAFSFASEPMINFKSCRFWKADAANTIKANSASFGGDNLGANVIELTQYINACTITGNNGMSAEDMARAGGSGVINDQDRGDRAYTLELPMRKDNANNLNTDALIITDTQMAVEAQFIGPYIAGSDPYCLIMVFPVVQLQAGPEDDGSPISKADTFEIMQDSTGSAFEAFVQSEVGTAYNATV